jgi:hypothetical protein
MKKEMTINGNIMGIEIPSCSYSRPWVTRLNVVTHLGKDRYVSYEIVGSTDSENALCVNKGTEHTACPRIYKPSIDDSLYPEDPTMFMTNSYSIKRDERGFILLETNSDTLAIYPDIVGACYDPGIEDIWLLKPNGQAFTHSGKMFPRCLYSTGPFAIRTFGDYDIIVTTTAVDGGHGTKLTWQCFSNLVF